MKVARAKQCGSGELSPSGRKVSCLARLILPDRTAKIQKCKIKVKDKRERHRRKKEEHTLLLECDQYSEDRNASCWELSVVSFSLSNNQPLDIEPPKPFISKEPSHHKPNSASALKMKLSRPIFHLAALIAFSSDGRFPCYLAPSGRRVHWF